MAWASWGFNASNHEELPHAVNNDPKHTADTTKDFIRGSVRFQIGHITKPFMPDQSPEQSLTPDPWTLTPQQTTTKYIVIKSWKSIIKGETTVWIYQAIYIWQGTYKVLSVRISIPLLLIMHSFYCYVDDIQINLSAKPDACLINFIKDIRCLVTSFYLNLT